MGRIQRRSHSRFIFRVKPQTSLEVSNYTRSVRFHMWNPRDTASEEPYAGSSASTRAAGIFRLGHRFKEQNVPRQEYYGVNTGSPYATTRVSSCCDVKRSRSASCVVGEGFFNCMLQSKLVEHPFSAIVHASNRSNTSTSGPNSSKIVAANQAISRSIPLVHVNPGPFTIRTNRESK